MRKQIEYSLEQIEQTRAVLIDVAQRLDENIPHNDVVEENKTTPFHMIRNIQLSYIDELDTHQKNLRADLDELSMYLPG